MKQRIGVIAIVCASVLAAACGDDGTPAQDAGMNDAGADGGAADGGATDAGTPDAGGDAGTPASPLAGIGAVEVASEGGLMFTEGPLWLPDEEVLLFTDIPANIIYRLTPDGERTEFRNPSNNANGLLLDQDGRLLAAEHGTRRVTRTLASGDVVAIAEQYMNNRLNSPNDLEVRSDGTIYFTDPPYGIQEGDAELDFNGLFRIPPGGGLVAEWMGPLTSRPNGVVLSPDEAWLYVADTADQVIRRFAVAADGSLALEDDPFIANVPGPDGMAVDEAGNLFVSTSQDVHVYAPDGTEWGTIEIPGDYTTNVAFGGTDRRTLYVTTQSTVYQVQLAGPGLP